LEAKWLRRSKDQRIRSCWHLGLSWGHLGPCWAVLGPSWAMLGRLGAMLGPSWAVLRPYWGYLGGIVGHLGVILDHHGANLAILGCNLGRFGRHPMCFGGFGPVFEGCLAWFGGSCGPKNIATLAHRGSGCGFGGRGETKRDNNSFGICGCVDKCSRGCAGLIRKDCIIPHSLVAPHKGEPAGTL
jgi:hypothetical protein